MNIIEIGNFTYFLKLFFITISTYFVSLKLINKCSKKYSIVPLVIVLTILIDIITIVVKVHTSVIYSAITLIILSSLLYSKITKSKIGNMILAVLISLSINYITFLFASMISFFLNLILKVSNDYLQLLVIVIIHTILLYLLSKIKRFKNGFIFLQNNSKNDYFDVLILNISVSILLVFIMITTFAQDFTKDLFIMLAIFSIIMIITIQKTLTMYYKHKLLVKELEDTKKELEDKNKEISELEKENLNFSKVSHSIAHKQEVLEYKLNQLSLNSEIAEELDISDKLKEISDEYSNITSNVSLSKTGVESIDNMLELQQAKCIKDHIDFDLKLSGSIHHMINNSIDEGDLEILLADHIKNAIIAINNSDNINRSILVKLGMIDKYYSLVIYDSGIEFKIDTLMNLGITPSSTHLDDGGTGMGFMNTFDTLNKTNGSIYINEIGKISKDNYTKSISIIFDNKHEYHISSYRSDEIKANVNREDLIIE